MAKAPPSDLPLLETLDAFYAAAADPADWPAALDSVAAVTGGIGASLTFLGATGTRFGAASTTLAAGVADFVAHWHRHDIIGARVYALRLKGLVSDLDLFETRVFDSDPFYRDFLGPLGARNMLGLVIPTPEGDRFSLTIHYDRRLTEVADTHRATLERLARPISRAVAAPLRGASADLTGQGLLETVGGLGFGAALLAADGAVIAANAAFGRVLDGHVEAGTRLRFRRPAVQAAFEAMVDAAGAPGLAAGGPDFVLLPRPAAAFPLFLRALPLPGAPRASDDPAPRLVLVLVTDPAQRETAVGTALVQAGLTRGESRVASLVGAGLTPAEAAARLGIAEETARTVLKRVYAKLGIARQADLVRFVERVAPLANL